MNFMDVHRNDRIYARQRAILPNMSIVITAATENDKKPKRRTGLEWRCGDSSGKSCRAGRSLRDCSRSVLVFKDSGEETQCHE